MAVLLTGATGFVGLNIAGELIGRGHAVVLFAPARPDALAGSGWFGRGQFVAGDVRSAADLARAFAEAPVVDVIHTAALTPDAQTEASEPDAIAAVNLVGTMRVMQAARRVGVRRVLGVSSVAVYGHAAPAPHDSYHEASSAPRPATLYGITKLAAEQAIHRLGALYGIDTVTVRLGPCFGIREYRSGARALMSPHWQCVEALLAGRECVLPRPMAVDWIDVADAARAIADLLHAKGLQHQLFNLGGGGVVRGTVDASPEFLLAHRSGQRNRSLRVGAGPGGDGHRPAGAGARLEAPPGKPARSGPAIPALAGRPRGASACRVVAE